jgi:hypothetical protein
MMLMFYQSEAACLLLSWLGLLVENKHLVNAECSEAACLLNVECSVLLALFLKLWCGA